MQLLVLTTFMKHFARINLFGFNFRGGLVEAIYTKRKFKSFTFRLVLFVDNVDIS